MQVVPEQQPPGQEVGSQVHKPPTQCWPEAHGTLLPHWQTPDDEQLSARMVSQATQLTPLVPQVANARVWHAPPAQQPLGQPVASHAQELLAQCRPAPQIGLLPHWQLPPLEQALARMVSQPVQAAPPMPQALAVGGAVQVEPEQQPVAQLPGVQPLQTPALQVPGRHD